MSSNRFITVVAFHGIMIQCPRGTRDFLPDEMERRRHYENILRRTARTFGFREIATPIFEETELFTTKSGPNILNEIYAFKDKGDRDIALRPELTAPVMRMFVNSMSNDPKPLKLFYFGQCFRYERPQSGRYREFFQFGAELIGNANAETDAEAIALAASMIKALGLREYKIRIGHIGILRKMLSDVNVPPEKLPEVLQKLDKKMYDDARAILNPMGISNDTADKIFRITETVGGKDVLDLVNDDAALYLRELVDILAAMGVTDIEIDLGVVRGLDYYTGMVFEAEAPSLGAEKQICGGGSYSLSELFGGEKVFSTGFAIGFDRILLAMEKEGQTFNNEGVDAYVVPVSDDVRTDAAMIVSMLRANGITADIDIMRRKMAKAMKHASSVNARYAVIVGKNELADDSVTVRDMGTGEQKMIKVNELVKMFS
jgi:histidyl-tRNA synthetase